MSPPEMMSAAGIDRISALPDEMLIYILSFLPIKLAFTTTILSKRWTPLCNYLTAFYFDDEGVKDLYAFLRFRRFVDTVMLSPHVQHQPLKTFSFMTRYKRYPFNVDKWVDATKQRGVENLHLSLPWCLISLSPRIFTSRTLVVLKLSGRFYVEKFVSVDLPSLKTLHLTKETIFGEREDFKKFLSGCSNLVELYAGIRFRDTIPPQHIKPCPSWRKHVPFTAVYNVKFLRIEKMERRCIMEKYIESYYREMPVFQNLFSIELCFGVLTRWDRIVQVLSHCPTLQTLVIEKRTQFGKEKWAYTEPVPECVSLHLRTCSIQNCIYADFEFAAYLVQNARLLQVMTLHSGYNTKESDKFQFFKQLSRCQRISPTCKLFWDTEEIIKPTRT